MNKTANRSVLVLMGLCCVVIGCTDRLDYGVKNVGTSNIKDVGVFINDDHSMMHGIVSPGATKGFGGTSKILRENVVRIVWSTADSKDYESELHISGNDLRDKRQILFVINNDMEISREWRF